MRLEAVHHPELPRVAKWDAGGQDIGAQREPDCSRVPRQVDNREAAHQAAFHPTDRRGRTSERARDCSLAQAGPQARLP